MTYTDRFVGGPYAGTKLRFGPTVRRVGVPLIDRRQSNPKVRQGHYVRTERVYQGLTVWRWEPPA